MSRAVGGRGEHREGGGSPSGGRNQEGEGLGAQPSSRVQAQVDMGSASLAATGKEGIWRPLRSLLMMSALSHTDEQSP